MTFLEAKPAPFSGTLVHHPLESEILPKRSEGGRVMLLGVGPETVAVIGNVEKSFMARSQCGLKPNLFIAVNL